jgi:hypothetical protein
MASIDRNYPGSLLYFTDKHGNPADIDTSTKPLRFEASTGGELVTIDNFVKGDAIGQYSCDVTTIGAGAVAGDIVADPDMTPEGEKELRIPVAFVIDPSEATGAAFTLGAGIDKP